MSKQYLRILLALVGFVGMSAAPAPRFGEKSS